MFDKSIKQKIINTVNYLKSGNKDIPYFNGWFSTPFGFVYFDKNGNLQGSKDAIENIIYDKRV